MQPSSVTVGLALAIGCVTSTAAIAGDDFRCTIERVAQSHEEPSHSVKLLLENYIGKQFTIERRTGLMAGALKNSYITSPQVIDYGSKGNSYKVVTTLKPGEGLGPGSNLYALVVDEFVEEAKKPFVFLENERVFFGTCEHF